MVKAGRIADMVTILGLLLAGIIIPHDVFSFSGVTSSDITGEVRDLVKNLAENGLRVVEES